MRDHSLVPSNNSELVTRTDNFARRGIDVFNELQQKVYILSEYDILSFKQKFSKIKNSIGEIPEEFLNGTTANPNDIDAFRLNDMLQAFDKIQIRHNYILDYVYNTDGHYAGEPLIYAREKDSCPISSPEEYYSRFPVPVRGLSGEEPTSEDSIPYLVHLEFENTPMGYFEFSIFCMTIGRFYLLWHSSYNDRKFILTAAGIQHFIRNRIGHVTNNEIDLLLSTDFAPKVQLAAKTGRVSMLSFEENIGYSFLHILIKHPNIFVGTSDEVVIKNHTTRLF